LEKLSDIKFHKNLSSGNWVLCGQTDRRMDRQTWWNW